MVAESEFEELSDLVVLVPLPSAWASTTIAKVLNFRRPMIITYVRPLRVRVDIRLEPQANSDHSQ